MEAGRRTMSDTGAQAGRSHRVDHAGAGSGNAVYGLGMIGAAVYFCRQADSVNDYLLAVLKALVWPAFLVYRAFQALSA
jgi:hypothetical protein